MVLAPPSLAGRAQHGERLSVLHVSIMARSGVIERFDAADGLGDILLDDGTLVRFGLTSLRDFRAAAPTAGTRVRVGETAPGFRGVLRATEVFLEERSWDQVWYVHGLGAPRVVDVEFPLERRVRLEPLDLARFADVAPSLEPDAIDARSFALPTRVPEVTAHEVLGAIAPLAAASARLALGFRRTAGEPEEGATFVGGDYADMGACDWPSADGAPLIHVLQIGADDARSIGVDRQVNVFAASQPVDGHRTPVLDAAGLSFPFGARPGADSVLVIGGPGGRRRRGPGPSTPPVAFAPPETRTVFPSSRLFRSDDDAVKARLAEFFTRVYALGGAGREVAPGLVLEPLESLYRRALPSADDLLDDLVLGGIARPLLRESVPRRRLASVNLQRIPELLVTVARGNDWIDADGQLQWRRWTLDWSEHATPAAWVSGT